MKQLADEASRILSNPWAQNVIGGVLSGGVVLLLSWLWAIWRRNLTRRAFKQVFGEGAQFGGCTLVYGALELRDRSTSHPYIKPAGNTALGFSISLPVSICEVRASHYLVGIMGETMGYTPAIRSDLEVHTKLDLDFISFGGPGSNFKTADCQTNSANRLIIFDQDTFMSRADKANLIEFEPGFDYGMVLKVRPQQFPRRVWFACAGRALLGCCRTSGENSRGALGPSPLQRSSGSDPARMSRRRSSSSASRLNPK
jgi:hypothetical protein